MRAVVRASGVVMIAAAWVAARGAAQPPAEAPREAAPPASGGVGAVPHVNYAKEWDRLAEESLPPEGREGKAENGWGAMEKWIEDFQKLQGETLGWTFDKDEGSWKKPQRISRVGYVYVERPMPKADPEDAEQPVAEKAAAEKVMPEFEKSDLSARLTALGRMPRMVRPTETQALLLQARMPELGGLRSACQLEGARMRLAAKAGDGDRALDALEQGLVLARLAAREPLFIGKLVSMSFEISFVDDLNERCGGLKFSEAQLARMASIVRTHRQRTTSWAHAIKTEAVMNLDSVQFVYSSAKNGDLDVVGLKIAVGMAALGGKADAEELKRLAVLKQVKTHRETIAQVNETTTRLANLMDWPENGPAVQTALQAYDDAYSGNIALQVLESSMETVVSSSRAELVHLDGFELNIAIERYRLRNGHLPAMLAELAPAFIEAVPRDVFSKDGYRYRMTKDDAGHEDYLLYTVGLDGEDNGGKPWPEQANGAIRYDFPMGPRGREVK